jgi:hypothetical protein
MSAMTEYAGWGWLDSSNKGGIRRKMADYMAYFWRSVACLSLGGTGADLAEAYPRLRIGDQ